MQVDHESNCRAPLTLAGSIHVGPTAKSAPQRLRHLLMASAPALFVPPPNNCVRYCELLLAVAIGEFSAVCCEVSCFVQRSARSTAC